MTREEAIKGLKSLVKVRRKYGDMQTMKDEIECLDMAIKALEQEPCEDVISREEALKIIEKYADEYERRANRIDTANPEYPAYHAKKKWNGRALGLDKAKEILTGLPSVTPQQKTEHWIDDKCSACGKGIEDLIESSEWYRNESPKYCPFCGTKIAEVGE